MALTVRLHIRQKVCVTEVSSNGIFFVQPDSQELVNLESLSQQISNFISNNQSASQGFHPSAGTHCFAQSLVDNVWYRAIVRSHTPENTYTVYYVDYGNTEEGLSLVRLFPSVTDFFKIPYQAICCQLAHFTPLGDGPWTEELTQAFRENVLNQTVPAEFHRQIHTDNHQLPLYSVTLYWDDSEEEYTVAEELVAMGLGTYNPLESKEEPPPSTAHTALATSSPQQSAPLKTFSYIDLEVGQKYDVYVTHAESPDIVWCQLSGNTNQFETLVIRLQDFMERTPTSAIITNPSKVLPPQGEPCCIIYSEDETWCRGLIQFVDVHSETADVLFVDFGNTETIPISRLYTLADEFFTVPAQAVSFSLSGIHHTGGDSWSSDALARFAELYTDQELICEVVGLDKNGYPSVKLTSVNLQHDIASVLIQEGLAVGLEGTYGSGHRNPHTEDLGREKEAGTESNASRDTDAVSVYKTLSVPVGLECDSCVTSIHSLSLFYCQLFSQADQLSTLAEQIHLHCDSPNVEPVSHVREGMPVLAQFKEDDQWYRAYMTPPSDDTLNEWGVVFVDYGNKQGINIGKLQEIPPSLLELPAQAFPCCLAGCPPRRASEKAVLNVFTELVLNELVVCLVKKKVIGDDGKSLYLVQLLKDGKDVLKQILQVKSTETVEVPNIPAITVPAEQRVLIRVCFIESTNRFACQLVDNASIIEDLQAQLNSSEQASLGKTLVKPVVGTCCAARFSEDDQWYRARVQKVLPEDQVEVLFADYGNTDIVLISSTRELADEHLKLPNQAILCLLDGVPPTCVTEVTEKFEEMCLEQDVEAEFLLTKCDLMTVIPCKLYKPNSDTPLVNDIIPSAHQLSPPPLPKPKTTDQKLSVPTGSRSGSRSRQSSDTPLIFPLSPMVPSQMDVLVSYIVSPSEFYVQPLSSYAELQTLMDDMFTYYSTQRKGFPLQSPYVGVHCSAPYHDGSYYRGIVKAVDSQYAKVFYLDFGNTEVVPVNNLFTLSSKFISLPAQAITCCLSGVSMAMGATANCDWSEDCIYNMKQAVLEQEVKMNVVNIVSETCYEVAIIVHSKNLSDLMVGAGLLLKGAPPVQQQPETPSFSTSSSAASTPTRSAQPQTKKSTISIIAPPLHQDVDVIVTEISPKCNIYCQLLSNSEQIEELKSTIAKFVATDPKPLRHDELKKGKYVLGQFTVDNEWYRGKIISKENEIKVGYIDFGNQEVLPLSRVCELPAILYDIPAQAVRCQLNGMDMFQPTPGAKEALDAELLYAECTMKVLGKEAGQKFIVDLIVTDDGQNVMEWALKSGLFSPLGGSVGTGGKGCTPSENLSNDSGLRDTEPTKLIIPSFLSKLDPNQNVFSGYLVHVDSPAVFYVQPAQSGRQMETLSDEMQEYYNNQVLSKNIKPATPLRGQFLVALYSEDQFWYRAMVEKVKGSEVEVLFIDYGNFETVPLSNTRPLEERFTSLPSQAIQCRVNGIQHASHEWSQDDKETFSGLIGGNLIKLRVGKMTKSFLEVLEVATEEGINVIEELVQRGCATHSSSKASSRSSSAGARSPKKRWQSGGSSSSTSSQASSSSASSKLPSPFKVREGEVLSVCVSHRDVGTIWVQPASQIPELSGLTDSLAEVYVPPLTNQLQLCNPKPGQICCAQFSEDDFWYRARITGQSRKEGTPVLFLDYGNTDVLSPERICSLRKEFLALPLLAIPCVLDSSSSTLSVPADSEEMINIQFIRKIKNKKWKATIVQNGGNPPAPSPFPRPGTPDIATITIPSLILNPSDQHQVYIVYSESPSSFWCQLSSQSEALDELMALMADFYTDKHPSVELDQGTFCVAQYSENNTWYRAKILGESDGDNRVSVFFVDYGNQEVLSSDKVAGLDPQFASLPCQAFHCSLFENAPGAFKEKHLESFYSLNFDQTFTVTVSFQLPNEAWLVQLSDEQGQSINNIFNNPTSDNTPSLEATPTYPTPHFEVGSRIDVFITCVNGPDSFYCQPLEMASELEELMTDIASYMSKQTSPKKSSLSLDSLNIGQSCLACYMSDDEWFRAQIEDIDVEKNQVLVHYTDYGNMAYIQPSWVTSLPHQFLSVPAQVIHCSAVLATPLSEPFSPELIEFFLQLIREDSQYTVRINGFTSSSQKYSVEMYSNVFKQSDITHLQAQLLNSAGVSMNIISSQATSTSADDDIPSSLIDQSQDALDDLPTSLSNSGLKGSKTPTTDLEESEGESTTTGEPLIHAPCKLSLANDEVVNVLVVHVQDPSLMYIQRTDCSSELESLSQEVNQYCSDFADKLIQETYHSGDFVLALYDVNEVWYRAHVKQVLPEKLLNVQFIDFGNSEDVATDKVIMCPGNFLELPIQAIPCSLAHVPNRDNWPAEYKDLIDELVAEKEMKATVVVPGGQGMSAAVLLSDLENTFEVSQKVLEHLQEECDAGVEEVLAGIEKSEETAENEEQGIETEGERKKEIDSKRDEEPEELLKDSDKEKGGGVGDLSRGVEHPNTEDECVCVQDETGDVQDEKERDEREAEETSKETELLEVVEEEKTDSEKKSVSEESQQQGSEALNDKVQVESEDKVASISARKGCSDEQSDLLTVKGGAPSPRPSSPAPNARSLQIGSKYDVYLINVNSPYDIVCQLYNDSGILESITSVLDQLYSESEDKYVLESPPVAGEYVCACYSKDGLYYRAKILHVLEDSKEFEIEFIDYGNQEKVPISSLKQLDPQVVVYSPLALKCGLSGLPEDPNRSDHFTSTLVNEILACIGEEGVLSLEVTSRGENGVYGVVLNTSTVCINDVVFETMSRLLREQESAENVSNVDTCDGSEHVTTDTSIETSEKPEEPKALSSSAPLLGSESDPVSTHTFEKPEEPKALSSSEPLVESKSESESAPVSIQESVSEISKGEEPYIDREDTTNVGDVQSANDLAAKEYLKHSFTLGDTLMVSLESYQSLLEIHCRIVDKEKLNAVNEAIADEGFTLGDGKMSIEGLDLAANTPLLVYSSEDGSWLRASLVELSPPSETALVELVDLGLTRTEKLENIKLLPQSLAMLSPPLSFVCRLPHLLETDLVPQHGFQDEEWELEWPSSSIKYFSDTVEGKSSFTAEVLSIGDGVVTVKLSYIENSETVDVREAVITKLKEPKPLQLDSSFSDATTTVESTEHYLEQVGEPEDKEDHS